MEGCPFHLFKEKERTWYHFCKGASACQLIKFDTICDGRYDCYDREVDDIPYASEREWKGCVFLRPAAPAVHATLLFPF